MVSFALDEGQHLPMAHHKKVAHALTIATFKDSSDRSGLKDVGHLRGSFLGDANVTFPEIKGFIGPQSS